MTISFADAAATTALLRCPGCRGALAWGDARATCESCAHAYAIEDGIPVLLVAPERAQEDEAALGSKAGQAQFFDHDVAGDYEISRPHGTPAFHRWLLGEKLRRSVAALGPAGGVALTVCGGSGLDAEFLARRGYTVVATDISLGAAKRVRERARRHGLPIVPVVADAEALPFDDASVDLAYVHDGLHNLEEPERAVAELARVARRAVSVNEPAAAAATTAAVKLGVAEEVEEAGNRVVRLTLDQLASQLRAAGFRIARAQRYAMFYRHVPGLPSRLLSNPAVLPLARLGYLAGDALIGRWGNKLTVQAIRREDA